MKRRDFITLLGGTAAWPLAARAQQTPLPVIGFVYPGVPELSAGVVAAFRKGLNETGLMEGRNVTVEYRFAYNDNARLPELLADLVQRGVAVIAGVTSQSDEISGKTFEILRELVPQLSQLAVVDSAAGLEIFRSGDAQAAQTLGIAVDYVDLGAPDHFDIALQKMLSGSAQ